MWQWEISLVRPEVLEVNHVLERVPSIPVEPWQKNCKEMRSKNFAQ